ncbi:MAG TPA: D-TA family PLP-dependent enzyme [Flavisolibacter sp.]|jgi:D-threonine aldolase|nr:D-TA family PLP-dependent enzyme [Flavisolibacter sp.]
MTNPWYLVKDINKIDSPALIIYRERVLYNIAMALQMVGHPSRLRPHVKTHKSPQVTQLMLQSGITKFKCATIAEAEMLAQCGAPDVLLAYQPTGPKVQRLLKLMRQYPGTHFSCLIDSEDAAKTIASESLHCSLVTDVFLDINTGMNRTGMLPKNAVITYDAYTQLKGIRPVGLHGYDGHINDPDPGIRKEKADEAFDILEKIKDTLFDKGMREPVIVVGGSPTFAIHAQRDEVECSPGTFVYWDRSYQQMFPDLGFLPAALVVSRVVSLVNETRICLDLGHKSVAAENALSRRIYFLNARELEPVAQSEEHLVVQTNINHTYKVGDVLYGMPVHVCPTCALYDEAYVIERGELKEVWKMTARDRKISI